MLQWRVCIFSILSTSISNSTRRIFFFMSSSSKCKGSQGVKESCGKYQSVTSLHRASGEPPFSTCGAESCTSWHATKCSIVHSRLTKGSTLRPHHISVPRKVECTLLNTWLKIMAMENEHLDAVYLFHHSARSPVCIDIQIAHVSLAVWQITINVSAYNNSHLLSPRCRPEVLWSWLDPLLRVPWGQSQSVSWANPYLGGPGGGFCSQVHSLLGEHSSLLAVPAKLLNFQRPLTLLISWPFHPDPSITWNPCGLTVWLPLLPLTGECSFFKGSYD